MMIKFLNIPCSTQNCFILSLRQFGVGGHTKSSVKSTYRKKVEEGLLNYDAKQVLNSCKFIVIVL